MGLNRKSLKDLLKNRLLENELPLLKRSYDVVGDIAILEIDKKLLRKKKIIADAVLKLNKSIKVVVRKKSSHEGKYRVQKYEFLAGNKNLKTLYRENDVAVKLDISKVYFTPRLSTDRKEIAKEIKPGEKVLVMFSGVGIYCFVIAKHSRAKEVYGMEINPYACRYADESLKMNKLKNVKLFCGDVRKVLPKLNKKFDRILMPLPNDSIRFLDLALKYIKKKGIVHFYFFSNEEDKKDFLESIKDKYKLRVLKVVKCGQIAPRKYRWRADFNK